MSSTSPVPHVGLYRDPPAAELLDVLDDLIRFLLVASVVDCHVGTRRAEADADTTPDTP